MMAIRPLLDGLGPSVGDSDIGTPGDQLAVVTELVAAVLDAHRHIDAIDTYGPRKKNRRYLTDPNASLYRKMHEDWLADAEALLARVRSSRTAGNPVDREQDLEVAVMTTRALLSFTMEKILSGVEKIRQGEFVTLEEVRRGVRAQAGD